MVQGDALTRKDAKGRPIIFSEWKLIKGKINKVQRTEYTFDEIYNDSINAGKEAPPDIFSLFSQNVQPAEERVQNNFLPVAWEEIYKELAK